MDSQTIFLLILILWTIFNIVFYIPNKLKQQQEKQSLYLQELYSRLNRLERKIDALADSKEIGKK